MFNMPCTRSGPHDDPFAIYPNACPIKEYLCYKKGWFRCVHNDAMWNASTDGSASVDCRLITAQEGEAQIGKEQD